MLNPFPLSVPTLHHLAKKKKKKKDFNLRRDHQKIFLWASIFLIKRAYLRLRPEKRWKKISG